MNRSEKKLLTRQAIIDSALLLSEQKNFAGVSLREIARESGITPAAFYRHFKDMDELRLYLIDQVGATLRQLMRQARQRFEENGSAVHTSIEIFMEYLDKNPYLFRFMASERSGGPAIFREALQKEKSLFVKELADDLEADAKVSDRPLGNISEAADLMVNLMFTNGLDALDLDADGRAKLQQRLKVQLRMTLMGANAMFIAEQSSEQSQAS